MNCSQQQLNNWNHQIPNPLWDSQIRHLNGSNMSLNLPAHGYYPQQVGWTPYPYPVGMIPIINQGNFPYLNLRTHSVTPNHCRYYCRNAQSSEIESSIAKSVSGCITSAKHSLQKVGNVCAPLKQKFHRT